ncbi:MAG: hypothetical protein AB7D51_07025 [Desulfovibrionaceae bacterium]
MKIGAMIPARMGSKRVPRKNVTPLGGRPLVFWTLDRLLAADCFDDVCVSTESGELGGMLREEYGGAVRTLLRPEELARDDAPMHAVLAHYLASAPEIDYYGTFLPTHPFREVETLRSICRQLLTGDLLRVVSVSHDHQSSTDLYYPVEAGVKPYFRTPAVCTGYMSSCYTFHHRDWASPLWRRHGYLPLERVLRVALSREEDVDIDTPDDLALAEAVAAGARITHRKSVAHEVEGARLVLPEGVAPEAFLGFLRGHGLRPENAPLVLEREDKPPYLFMISESGPKAYFRSGEALEHFKPTARVRATTCNSDQPDYFVRSPHYRVLPAGRELFIDKLERPRFSPRDDKAFREGGVADDGFVPWENTVLLDDLKAQPFYLDPVVLVEPGARR